MDSPFPNKGKAVEVISNRRHLAFGGSFYLVWWFAVEAILPEAFNPFLSRLMVVSVPFAFLGLSYCSGWVRHNLRTFFILSTWLITLHYYYLFHQNSGDINWVIGSYVTVLAVSLFLPTAGVLMAYTVFVLLLSLSIMLLLPSLQSTVFFPGLITIMIQANIGVRFRMRMIKSLKEGNERFQLLIDSTFEGVLVHEEGRIVEVNEALVRMSGYSKEELMGMNILQLVHPDERTEARLSMKLDEVVVVEVKGLTKKGEEIDIEIRGKKFVYDNRTVRLVNVQDISDRKRAEKERISALAMSENLRLRDEFISIASHELKTPLSSLKLQTQMFERNLKKNDPKATSHEQLMNLAAVFCRQTNRLAELVEKMLDVSRISAGRLILDGQDFDYPELVREIAESLQVPGFRLELPERLMIQADRIRIGQVVENLFTNAIKYGEGKPVLVRMEKSGETALLTVEDHGLGIGEEFTGRIFNRFERAISAENISGLGLGLYISKQIVEAHGGSIAVASKLHAGSAFTVRLPLESIY